MGGMAKMFDGGLLGKRALRPQICDGQWALYRQAFTHDFTEQTRHCLIRQQTLV